MGQCRKEIQIKNSRVCVVILWMDKMNARILQSFWKVCMLKQANTKKNGKMEKDLLYLAQIWGKKTKTKLWYLPEGPLRNVYICVIFSCYSGYQSVFSFRHMHFFATEQTCGFQAHHYTSHLAFNPSVPTRGPLVQYTALQPRPVTLQAALSHPPGTGTRGRGGKRPNSHQCK
jgi:hypothetical protein